MVIINAEIAPLSAVTSSSTNDQPRILIVDDETAVLFAYRRLIEGNGYVADVCETLDEAIAYIKANPYFAVITDLRLTGTNSREGLEVLACIREHQPQAKMIVITGYGGKETFQSALTLGVTFYFNKPMEPSVILETLRHLREDDKAGKEPTGVT